MESLVAPTQISNLPKKALAMLSKSLATAWCPTIATDADLGTCAQRIGIHQDITATTVRSKRMPQKVQPSCERIFWNESKRRYFVFMSAPMVRGGT
jgi:hypothetical protein